MPFISLLPNRFGQAAEAPSLVDAAVVNHQFGNQFVMTPRNMGLSSLTSLRVLQRLAFLPGVLCCTGNISTMSRNLSTPKGYNPCGLGPTATLRDRWKDFSMSTDPAGPPQQPSRPAPDAAPVGNPNGFGIAGFVIALCGIVTCGLGFPVGLIVSLIGLRRKPKGLAIAGTLIGAVGTTVAVIGLVLYILLGVLYFKLAAESAQHAKEAGQLVQTDDSISRARSRVDEFRTANERVPDQAEGGRLIRDLKDGWGNALRYGMLENGYEIRSAGRDGQFGTDDDRTMKGNATSAEPAGFDGENAAFIDTDLSNDAPH
jgi:hypothetical protein